MAWRKPERDVKPTANLKQTTHMHFIFDHNGAPAPNDFIDWFSTLSLDGPRPEVARRQLTAMQARLQPGSSVLEMLKQRGYVVDNKLRVPLADDLRVLPRYMALIDFQRFRFDGVEVGIDYFNPRNELDIPWVPPGPIYEVFVTSAVREKFVDAFVLLAQRVVDRWPVTFAFGGASTFTARFALGYAYGPKHFPRGRGAEAFLWPLTFLRSTDPTRSVVGLPIHRVVGCARGALVQTFEEFNIGHQDRYLAAARGLGLRSLWEFQIGHKRKH